MKTQEGYRRTERGTRVLVQRKLAAAERAVERSYVDVRSRGEAAEAAEEALGLIAEARELLRAEERGPWDRPSLATGRRRREAGRSEQR